MTTVFSAIPLPNSKPSFFQKSDILRKLLIVQDESQTVTMAPLAPTSKDGPDTLDPDLSGLNSALSVLVQVFPDVQPEVFREMLLNLSKESRVEVITEHLLKDKSKWAKGRYRTVSRTQILPVDSATMRDQQHSLAREDCFRSATYRRAVKMAFYEEFKGLSHATVKAVLAEQNHSYTLCRPILQELASKSWRHYLTNFWTRKRNATAETTTHPFLEWMTVTRSHISGRQYPSLRPTGSHELDAEITENIIEPIYARHKATDLLTDLALAKQINEEEAEEAEAMFDCECCYTSSTFEEIATCDTSGHLICFRCIRHATNEALFGQGWARNISNEKVSVRCLAPSLDECMGCVPTELVKRAVCLDKDGEQTWCKLEDRIAGDSITKSKLPLLQCPFCPYAEVDDTTRMTARSWLSFANNAVKTCRLRLDNLLGAFLAAIFYSAAILGYPLVLAFLLFLQIAVPADFESALRRTSRKRRGLKFNCRSPTCSLPSCSLCFVRWVDPHICHETSTLSLRHAIESATTAAVKRTCPKCSLSFVKSSGCNKLVCNCGYAMCYVCRNEIGKEGYGHFCQHFRERGGRCSECDRCDLYIVEDEEAVIRRAAEKAESDWREKEGGEGVKTSALLAELNARGSRPGVMAREVISGTKHEDTWSLELLLDVLLQATLA